MTSLPLRGSALCESQNRWNCAAVSPVSARVFSWALADVTLFVAAACEEVRWR